MVAIIRVLLLALTVAISTVSAQNFQGVATYKTQRKVDIKLDSTQMNDEMQQKMLAMMKKQFQKTFNLTFNREVSTYKQEGELSKPQFGGGGFEVVVMGNGGGDDVLYKNTKENRYAEVRDSFGKVFLIQDTLEPIEWKLESETKYIGEYQCFKATFVKKIEKPKVFSNSATNVKDEDENEEEDEQPEMIERVVTAWYTPQIPVSNGPDDYQGLPGLILEVHDGDLTIVCSKIVINPEDKIEIEEPTKGKKVNREEYKKIMDKKAKEMMERYAPRKGRDNGETIEIRIGG